FIRPFIVTFFIVMFILLMLFLFKYIDDLIGKGFEWYVILELLFYASATNVAMALPLAILLSSIMTFGSLGENYELVAIKSAGISLRKAMMPLVIAVITLSTAAFLFSDYMLPVANLKMGSLLYDVRNQKAAFGIREGVFNNDIPGYSIRVERKDPDGQTLHNVLIYSHVNNSGNGNVLLAKEGRMFRTEDSLVLKLKNGIRYEEMPGAHNYNPRERFVRYRFKETEQKFDLSAFKLTRTDESLFRSNYAMLNMDQLKYYRDSFMVKVDSNRHTVFPYIKVFYKQFGAAAGYEKLKPRQLNPYVSSVLERVPGQKKGQVLQIAKDEVRSISEALNSKVSTDDDFRSRVRGYMVEYNRKLTLSFSCLVLFFIGAPLGAIIRKGGLGLPVVTAVTFFLIYHTISTIGEKSAKQGTLPPEVGMWIAIIVLTPLGAFLTYKATVDSVLFDIDIYKQWFKKIIPRKKA
ncbi:MAG TPA: LptF/LptG family permease, partial [Sphingobacteriaceae bacterium]